MVYRSLETFIPIVWHTKLLVGTPVRDRIDCDDRNVQYLHMVGGYMGV